MKVYRVAKEQKFSEGAYEKVDDRDLSNDSKDWVFEKAIEIINISKDANERRALIRIIFTEKDIIALYEGLMKGREKKLSRYENLKTENDKLKEDTRSLRKTLKE